MATDKEIGMAREIMEEMKEDPNGKQPINKAVDFVEEISKKTPKPKSKKIVIRNVEYTLTPISTTTEDMSIAIQVPNQVLDVVRINSKGIVKKWLREPKEKEFRREILEIIRNTYDLKSS